MRKIYKTICLWCDLLGYGAPFKASNWMLNTEASLKNLERIESLKMVMPNISFFRNERLLLLNDGIIRSIDQYETTNCPQNFLYWFQSMLLNFHQINYIDKNDGHPGARAVLTTGHRYEYTERHVTEADITMTSEERKKELSSNILVYAPSEFQMNTAFSKAYIMESAGSKAGLKGNKLFIDIEFLEAISDILISNKGTYLYMDDDALVKTGRPFEIEEIEGDFAYHEARVNENKVNFRCELNIDTLPYHWSVEQEVEGEKSELFKVWFHDNKIEYQQDGIDTTLLVPTKFIPWDGEMVINLEDYD